MITPNDWLRIYEQEMCQVLPYKWDTWSAIKSIGTMAICVLGVVIGMLAMAGVF